MNHLLGLVPTLTIHGIRKNIFMQVQVQSFSGSKNVISVTLIVV